ncbi:MAG: hypothetical protein L0Y35_06885 [Flammeovirgaceae bacterium]|nr:hypothetical protein [Flammeovirgaceae bacterium]
MQKILFFLCLIAASTQAQQLENVRAQMVGDKVLITYDINQPRQGQKFIVLAYGSHNNFTTPLSLVSGDVGAGKELQPGTGLRIEWDIRDELREFTGDITFELQATVVSALFIERPSSKNGIRRGKKTRITWRGGKPNQTLAVELIKGGAIVNQLSSTQNNGTMEWAVPKEIELGKDYQIHLNSPSGSVSSESFSIKRKIPLALKALPILIIGVLSLPKKDDGAEPDLPVPPDPN